MPVATHALNVMSFFYLFIATWILTIIVSTLLAKQYGAAEKYSEEETKTLAWNQEIDAYRAYQEATGRPPGRIVPSCRRRCCGSPA